MSEYRVDEAFGILPRWVVEAAISDRAVRLYGLLSAIRDYESGTASGVGRKYLAKTLHCSEDSLDRAKAELEKVGAITVTRERLPDGQIAKNVYTIHRVSAGSRKQEPAGSRKQEEVAADQRGGGLLCDESSSSSSAREPGDPRVPKTISGRKVTSAEHDLTDGILAAFNAAAGRDGRPTRYAGKEWREAIVRRMRDHPDLALADYERLIREQFADPWWKGDPTPSVIFGSSKPFERALNGARGGAAKTSEFAGDLSRFDR